MKKFILFISAMTLLITSGYSQELKGRVLNETGSPASLVSIHIKGTTNGIVTDVNGNFKIKLGILPDTLLFTAPDFEPYQVVITDKNIGDPNFEVVMLRSREKTMSEVVVTAHGMKRMKKELRNSTSTDRSKPVASADKEIGYGSGFEGLEGKVSGVKISPGMTSEPLLIRGYSSYSGIDSDDGDIRTIDEKLLGISKSFASKLTAGEVNDFLKWKMWEDYNENEFSQWSKHWGITPTKRYSVQLTDKKFNAIVGEKLFLINRTTKDTLWRTITDNTGKAELWSGFFSNSAKNGDDVYIVDRFGNMIAKPTMFEQEMNLLPAERPCSLSNDVDIAFMVDATGSMRDEIEFLKLELEDVLRKAMDKYKTLNLRAASVFYRDSSDEYLTKQVDFHDDLLKAINHIKLQNAAGGGDFPEAVDDALEVAIEKLNWTPGARTRLLFLVLDAPPHEVAKEKMHRLIEKAAAMGIRIIPIGCSGIDKSTEFLMRSIALATNGSYTFLTNHSGIGNAHIEPTTDKYQVEMLNELMERLIGQFVYAKECGKKEEVPPVTHQSENILKVKLYPNPTNGRFTIESSEEIKEMFIADFTGKILMRLGSPNGKGRWLVDIGKYPSATYLVKYITKDNKWGTEKVVLQR